MSKQVTQEEVCIHCGKTEKKGLHIRYGNDLDNPRKHKFEIEHIKTIKATQEEVEKVVVLELFELSDIKKTTISKYIAQALLEKFEIRRKETL